MEKCQDKATRRRKGWKDYSVALTVVSCGYMAVFLPSLAHRPAAQYPVEFINQGTISGIGSKQPFKKLFIFNLVLLPSVFHRLIRDRLQSGQNVVHVWRIVHVLCIVCAILSLVVIRLTIIRAVVRKAVVLQLGILVGVKLRVTALNWLT